MHDSAQALRGKKLLLVGFTLFSMFFGAGNLIFPPFLGAQAGTALWPAFVGFAVSAIGLPIAGVAAVARAGGLPALAGRVHPRFAQVFAVLVYLSIGPCLAIPRTASTSFEMLTPLVGRSTPGQFIYSLVFFAAAYFVALKPEKLTQRLGRILCPALLVLIVVLFAGCILRPAAPGYGTPAEAYAALPAAQGVLDGYQTMDALAALNFGAVIALNLQAVGITEESAVRRGTIRAGFIAGGMLLVVYAMLTHIGGISGAAFPGSGTGGDLLLHGRGDLLGDRGVGGLLRLGRGGVELRLRQAGESPFSGRGVDRFGEVEEPREHPVDIAVDDGARSVVSRRADGRRGIVAHAAQRTHVVQRAGKHPSETLYDLTGGGPEVAGAAVIAQTAPQRQHVVQRSRSQ